MKRVLSMLLAVCLCCGLLAGCGKRDGGEKEEKVIDFDEKTNKTVTLKEISFEVPNKWEQCDNFPGESEESVISFKSEDIYLKVISSGKDIEKLDDNDFKSYLSGLGLRFGGFEISEISDKSYGSNSAKVADVEFSVGGTVYNGNVFEFEFAIFIFGVTMDSALDYGGDIEKVLSAMKIDENYMNSTDDDKKEVNIHVKDVVEKLKTSGVPIIYEIIYTEETDPNGEGAHLYIEKGNFADSRIEEEYSEEEPLSGTIEIFSSAKEAQERASLLNARYFAYYILNDNILIRLSSKYSEEQLKEFSLIIGGTVEEIEKSVEGTKAQEEEKESSVSYIGGMYKIGVDMPAGEYLITSSEGYLEVASDSTGNLDSIITNDNYTNRIYITVQDGQYLKFDGTAIPVADAAGYTTSNGIYLEGMYLVGKDIPAGEYKVSSLGGGYYEVSANSSGTLDAIITNENFDSDVYLTVSDGQYLKLNRAQIKL